MVHFYFLQKIPARDPKLMGSAFTLEGHPSSCPPKECRSGSKKDDFPLPPPPHFETKRSVTCSIYVRPMSPTPYNKTDFVVPNARCACHWQRDGRGQRAPSLQRSSRGSASTPNGSRRCPRASMCGPSLRSPTSSLTPAAVRRGAAQCAASARCVGWRSRARTRRTRAADRRATRRRRR